MKETVQRLGHPVFSVVIPVYNVEGYLERCADSVLSQDFDDYEIILVDDGSSDASGRICDTYAKRHHHVRVIHKENGGLCSARNVGLEHACGEYIVAIDADDWIELGALSTLWERAIEPYGPDAIIFNASKAFDDKSPDAIPCSIEPGMYDREMMEASILPFMIYDPRQSFCKGLFLPTAWNKVFRKTILDEHHCFDERIRMGEDNAFVFEALYYSDTLVVLEESLYCYYQGNSQSITSTYDADRFRNNRILIDYMAKRLGGREAWLDQQLNAFKAYWLFMAVFHEARSGKSYIAGCRHLREEIRAAEACKGIDAKLLPIAPRIYFRLLQLGLYELALCAAYVGTVIRKR